MTKELLEFERYLAHLGEGLGHGDRRAGLRGYCAGLMSPLKRKSVEPMASHLAPATTRARHQSLHHFVADSAWSDAEMLPRVAQWVVPAMDFGDGGWWIVDDTGFPKQGQHSVGVARQYCGMLGVTGQVMVWPPGHAPLPPAQADGRRNASRRQRLGQAKHEQPLSLKELAFELPPEQWQTLEWRQGSNISLCSRFARVRVQAAHREHLREQMRPPEWLLIEC